MRRKDFDKLYKYIGKDKYIYVVIKDMKFYKITEARNILLEEISKLNSNMFVPVNSNVSSKGEVSFTTIPPIDKANSYLINHKNILPIVEKLGMNIDELIKNDDIKVKTLESIYSQQINRYNICPNKDFMDYFLLMRQKTLAGWGKNKKKELLNKSTTSENIVFKRLYSAFGKRVKRQQLFIISGKAYFADISIKSKKVVIEVDGGYHNSDEQKEKDRLRDEAFKSIGYITIRITNEQVNDKKFLRDFILNIKNI